MPIINHNKLVRDLIPRKIVDAGDRAVFTLVRRDEELQAMRRKIVEEANELSVAETREQAVSEIADLLEIVKVYRERLGILDTEVYQEANRKRAELGSFQAGFLLLSTSDESLVQLIRRL